LAGAVVAMAKRKKMKNKANIKTEDRKPKAEDSRKN